MSRRASTRSAPPGKARPRWAGVALGEARRSV
jgi:hypothetical protein